MLSLEDTENLSNLLYTGDNISFILEIRPEYIQTVKELYTSHEITKTNERIISELFPDLDYYETDDSNSPIAGINVVNIYSSNLNTNILIIEEMISSDNYNIIPIATGDDTRIIYEKMRPYSENELHTTNIIAKVSRQITNQFWLN